MNTTELIGHWNMSGASRDLTGRFRSAEDIRAAIASRAPKEESTLERAPLLMKRADEEHWATLPTADGPGR